MAIYHEDYLQCLKSGNAEQHRELLEASYQEATRVMSPRGLENYLQGIKALCSLGRGQDMVLTYIQEMPAVAKEVGEDIIPDCIQAFMKLASHTSGSVITLLIGHMPLAAQRLGDADLVRGFLGLIHQLAGKTPRGLRTLMENLEELLAKLTLGGLRRWALWGAQAHQRDLDGQIAYFSLQSEASKAVLQKERRGTLFVDNQRKLNFYLRALWGRAFFMRPTAGDYESREGLKPYIEDYTLHIPDAYDQYHAISGLECYRATVAHCAAHMVYTHQAISAEQLNPVQMKLIELFEDARVEYCAQQDFPGIGKLWEPFFTQPAVIAATDRHPVVDCMWRLAHALLNRQYQDSLPWVQKTATAFHAQLAHNSLNNQICWDFGLQVYHIIAKDYPIPSLRVLDSIPIPYRDDNRFVWAYSELAWKNQAEAIPLHLRQIRRQVSIMEMVNEVDCELAGDDAQEIWTCNTEFFRDGDPENVSINQLEGKTPVSPPAHYQEWDYQAQLYRPDWATVIEHRAILGDPKQIDAILQQHRPLASRIRYLIDALQPQGIVRKRGFEEGEEIDLNAAVKAFTDIRRGVMPDTRINIRIVRHLRDLAVIVLMDLSESTNQRINPNDEYSQTILDLTREATSLLAWAIDSIGDPFAVHGFASDGRHAVQYTVFKAFSEPFADKAKARLAGMKGGLSTRMGAALRHAGSHLAAQSQQKKLVLVITDGEPADIDERDPQYLRHDTKKAVEDLRSRGIYTYCLTLDPQADRYVARIFGENHYSIIDDIALLPARLPALFAQLTH